MTPLEKAHAVTQVSISAQQLSLAGIRRRHPGASDRECDLRLAALKLGRDRVRAAYPDARTLLGA
jgi:hypothetical protein